MSLPLLSVLLVILAVMSCSAVLTPAVVPNHLLSAATRELQATAYMRQTVGCAILVGCVASLLACNQTGSVFVNIQVADDVVLLSTGAFP